MDIKVLGAFAYRHRTVFVLNRKPEFTFIKEGALLTAEDGPLRKFYRYDPPSMGHSAFGGMEFEIPMKNGSNIRAVGQWWDHNPTNFKQVFFTTEEDLRKGQLENHAVYAEEEGWYNLIRGFVKEYLDRK